MSYFCQFCDKEMLFDESVVYIEDYITCGNDSCEEKAHNVAREIREENKMIKKDVMLFSSKTPTNPASWRVVPIEDYPEFIIDTPDVMERMLEGEIANKYHCNGNKIIYYCAKLTKDVQKEINERLS